jgi:hypothetical protein
LSIVIYFRRALRIIAFLDPLQRGRAIRVTEAQGDMLDVFVPSFWLQ